MKSLKLLVLNNASSEKRTNFIFYNFQRNIIYDGFHLIK